MTLHIIYPDGFSKSFDIGMYNLDTLMRIVDSTDKWTRYVTYAPGRHIFFIS